MAWIRTIDESDATGDLARHYTRGANPDGTVDNVLKVHALSPDSLHAHLELYITAMHRPSPLSRIDREIVGTHVSRLNDCAYCCRHHSAGLKRLVGDARPTMADALQIGDTSELDPREQAMVRWAGKLTTTPGAMTEADVQSLRDVGLDDRSILDLGQVVAYFCYVNRLVLGLGAQLEAGEQSMGQWPAD